jgi:release factor glutamine methyltransferase
VQPTGASVDAELVARLTAAGCVFAEDEARLLVSAVDSPAALDRLVARRVAGEPLEHVLGWADFAGVRVRLEPGVFVPRRRSELLVREAVPLLAAGSVVVDLCCGSGALGLAAAHRQPGLELCAADLDPLAVACARKNLEPVGGRVFEGDLFDALPEHLRGRVDVLLVNAPYVPTDAVSLMPAEARLHEPRSALDGGADGLDVHRRVAAAAPGWLAPGGRLLVESSARQAPGTAGALRAAGFAVRVVRSDELDATAVVGTAAG